MTIRKKRAVTKIISSFVLMIAMVLLVTSEKPAPEATELPATPDSSS